MSSRLEIQLFWNPIYFIIFTQEGERRKKHKSTQGPVSAEIWQDIYSELKEFNLRFYTNSIRSSIIDPADGPLHAFCRKHFPTHANMPAHTQTLKLTDVWSTTSHFWQSGFHSSHWPASPQFIRNLLFSRDRLCNYVKDAFSLLHKMPLKHLHSAKVHIRVPHLATFTHIDTHAHTQTLT